MTKSEMETIADGAADKAINRLFLTLGYNLSDPGAIIKLQDDMKHIRRWREATDQAKQHAFKTVIAVLVSGALGWLGLIFWKHQ